MQTKSRAKREIDDERFVAGSSRVVPDGARLRGQMEAAVQAAMHHMTRGDNLFSDQGARIKALRTERRMTQQQLADKLHVDKRTLQFWEAGKVDPSYDNKRALGKALHTTITYIQNGDEVAPKLDPLAEMRAKLDAINEKLDRLLGEGDEADG